MSYWQERAEEAKESLRQMDEWIASGAWGSLPDGVQNIICRGINEYRDKIDRYEKRVKNENKAE